MREKLLETASMAEVLKEELKLARKKHTHGSRLHEELRREATWWRIKDFQNKTGLFRQRKEIMAYEMRIQQLEEDLRALQCPDPLDERMLHGLDAERRRAALFLQEAIREHERAIESQSDHIQHLLRTIEEMEAKNMALRDALNR
ncbi:hypothetical protein GUITHDRAFT_151246, partial [Guillardia theta CCMP2712]